MSSSQSHPSSPSHAPGKEPEVPFTPSAPASSSSSPKTKKRRTEPVGNAHVSGEPFVDRSASNTGSWAWYPDLLRTWVQAEGVPKPTIPGFTPVASALPPIPYPMERVFAAVVARMDRELRRVRAVADEVTGLLERETITRNRLDELYTSLAETDMYHEILAVDHEALRVRVIDLEERLEAAELRVAAVEEQLAAAAPQAAGGQEPQGDDQEGASGVSSAGSAA